MRILQLIKSKLFPKQSSQEEAQRLQKEDMIEGIEELSETTVKEIMVPRIDVVSLSEDLSREEVLKLVTEQGHSRYPVYKDTIDNIIGVLYAKDLLRVLNTSSENFALSDIVRKPYFVPESVRLDALLQEIKKRRVHIVIVVDEYGGVSGIVCLEDILEEIIGDIQDEFDNEREDIVCLSEQAFLCEARTSIDDINETLGIELPSEDFDTLGGFVFDQFGKIPVRYEKVRWNDLDFIIQDMDGHKIRTVKIVRVQHAEKTE